MIIVIPPISSGNAVQECLNSSRAQDETFLTADVRADIQSHFRAAQDPAQWGLMGFSSGGYCAANLALRNPSQFGSAASLDGYFQASAGAAARLLRNDPIQVARNSPVDEARMLTRLSTPLPSFFLSVGTSSAQDVHQAELFIAAISPIAGVSVLRVVNRGHDFYAWNAAVPAALNWSWHQLAPPDLRVSFPTTDTANTISSTMAVAPQVWARSSQSSDHRYPAFPGHGAR